MSCEQAFAQVANSKKIKLYFHERFNFNTRYFFEEYTPHDFPMRKKEMEMEERWKLKAFLLPAAPACGLIRRGYSPANLGTARYAMAARRAQRAAGRAWRSQQTKASYSYVLWKS